MVKDSGSSLTMDIGSHNKIDPTLQNLGGDSTDDRGPGPHRFQTDHRDNPTEIDYGQDKLPTVEVRRGIKWGPTLMAQIKVNNTEVEAIVDTGAEVTILSKDFCAKLIPNGTVIYGTSR